MMLQISSLDTCLDCKKMIHRQKVILTTGEGAGKADTSTMAVRRGKIRLSLLRTEKHCLRAIKYWISGRKKQPCVFCFNQTHFLLTLLILRVRIKTTTCLEAAEEERAGERRTNHRSLASTGPK
jgi:hypothetical protein